MSEDNKISDYERGFIDGITAYAHYENGVQMVGTTGTTLKTAKAKIKKTWNYNE